MVKKIEPNEPMIVLFGLIFVNLGPLKVFPKTNPPISDATHDNNNENKIILNSKFCDKKINK